MIKELSDMHTNTVLLTGDNKLTAKYFTKQVDITDVRTELLTGAKV